MAKAKQSPPMRVRKKLVKERPDTDDPSQMMAAEAACEVEAGPLLPPKYPDEDWDETKEEDEESQDNSGGTPKR